MKANELEEYSAKELDRLAREREEAIKAKGGLPYLGSLAVGESRILLMPKVPLDNPDKDGRPRKTRLSDRKLGVATRSQYKKRRQDFTSSPLGGRGSGQPLTERTNQLWVRKQFVVKKPNDEQEYAWTVNIKSPLYRDLLGFLPKSPIMLRVIRTGEGRTDTRYTVKAA